MLFQSFDPSLKKKKKKKKTPFDLDGALNEAEGDNETPEPAKDENLDDLDLQDTSEYFVPDVPDSIVFEDSPTLISNGDFESETISKETYKVSGPRNKVSKTRPKTSMDNSGDIG